MYDGDLRSQPLYSLHIFLKLHVHIDVGVQCMISVAERAEDNCNRCAGNIHSAIENAYCLYNSSSQLDDFSSLLHRWYW